VRRLFFALWPDAGVRDRLAARAEVLPARCGRRVARDNLHLTLVFLGSVDDAVVECLLERAAAIRRPDFTLTLERLGWFRRARVTWLAPERIPAALQGLVDDINAAVRGCGLATEEGRPYRPHLTLSRKAMRPPRKEEPDPIHWHISDFCLVESIIRDTGPEYRILQRWVLTSE